MTDESYWTYRASEETPTLREAIALGAITPEMTDTQWHQLTPGMRREIVRDARKAFQRQANGG